MGPSPLTLLRDNTDVLIDNTIVETALFTYPVAAYTLDGDRGLRVSIDGAQKNDSASDVTVIYRWKLGATTLWQHTQISTSFVAGPDIAPFQITAEILAKNSDAVQELFGRITLGQIASPTTGEGSLTAAVAADAVIYGTATEDGTTDLDLAFTVEMDVADADAWFLHRRSIVELL